MPVADGNHDDIPTLALTECQQQVVALIAEGATNQEIATRLGVERETVSDHIAHILWQLGVKDRTQIAIWAARNRLHYTQQ